MDVRLPPELQRAVEALARQFPTKDSSARAAALSATYRSGGSSVAAVQSDADVAAYATARMPATYAAITAALTATHDRVPDFAPHSLLDAGAGPGTASWTAASFWPGLRSITMVDSHARFRAVAAQFTQSSSSSALQASDIVTGDLLTWSAQGRFDLVIAAYALAEIAQTDLPRALRNLWQATDTVLLLVEPGTPAGFQRILLARKFLLDMGAKLLAPCPHEKPCPLISPDWCHFAQRLPRLKSHMRAKEARVPFEDEKFSYLAVARVDLTVTPSASRILAPPQTKKAEIRLRLCGEGRVDEVRVPARDKPAYRAASRKNWGETL